jgi:hypothetical protein
LTNNTPVIACETPAGLRMEVWRTCPVKITPDGINILFQTSAENQRLLPPRLKFHSHDVVSDGDELAWRLEFPNHNSRVLQRHGRAAPTGTLSREKLEDYEKRKEPPMTSANTVIRCNAYSSLKTKNTSWNAIRSGTYPMRVQGKIQENVVTSDGRQHMVI